MPIGGDVGDDEAEAGVERLRVLAGAERDSLGAECSCVGQPRVGELRAQALAMTGAVDHAPAEGRGVFVVEGEAAAGDKVAVVVDDQIVVGAVWVEQVSGEVVAFVWGEVTRHVGVEQCQAGGGVGWGVGAQGGHGGTLAWVGCAKSSRPAVGSTVSGGDAEASDAGWPLHRDCWLHPCTQPFRACALQGQPFGCPDSLLANPSNPRSGVLIPLSMVSRAAIGAG